MRISLEEEKEKPIPGRSIPRRRTPRYRRKVRLGKEDLLLVLVVPSIVFLIYYGVVMGELSVKDGLTFLTGLLSGAWVGTSTGLSATKKQ